MFSAIKVAVGAAGLLLTTLTTAATVSYNFNITWVTANPDGAFHRPVVGINGQWPLPQIDVTVGDRVVVNVLNQLGNRTTSLHFHGLYMNGSTEMDGPVGVTQCAIPPGGSFTYDFQVNQSGTYWYHSHDTAQYPDGLRGPLVVHDPDSPYKGHYDEEIVLTLSDWYHEQMPSLMKSFISYTNPTGAEPVPDAALMNDTQNLTVSVQPEKTYRFRIINMGAFAGQYLWFEDHMMSIVEVDGIYTEAVDAEMIYLTAGQRYSVLITMKNETSSNYAFVSSMDQDLFDTVPDELNPNATSWLVYDVSKPLPGAALLDGFDPFDDFTLVPKDGEALLEDVDYSFNLDMKMDNLGDGANYAFFNNATYVQPLVPSLYTALSTSTSALTPFIYGPNTNAFILSKGQVIEIVLNSADRGRHPFHLHGHSFQAVVRSAPDAGPYIGNETLPSVPMRRDTFSVNRNGNIVLRFRADNPGIWLFHCHIEWHVASGLVATMIEAPEELQKSLTIPEDHLKACQAQGVPTVGNAAGNTKDLLDLRGANVSPAPLPSGFETRGILALAFSCVAALLGMAVISWYGVGEIGKKQPAAAAGVVLVEEVEVDGAAKS